MSVARCRFNWLQMAMNMHFYSVMMSPRTAYDECVECARLLARYEAATFEQARIHNAFDLALNLGDYPSTRHIKLEAFAVTTRRNGARAEFVDHQAMAHRFAPLIGVESPAVAMLGKA